MSLPQLDPREHAEIERLAGRRLSNDEAQALLHEATIFAAFEFWLQNGAPPRKGPAA